MPLSPEEQEDVREQLREQVAHLPEEKKVQALQQIASLTPEALEELVKQSKERADTGEEGDKQSIFRMIVEKKIPSNILAETPQALAVLDINPISPGHTLIIPKKPVTKATRLSPSFFQLAKRIGKRMTSKAGAQSIEITTQEAFGETIIHIIPGYGKPLSLSSPRTKATPEQLTAIQQKLKLANRKQPTVKRITLPSSPGHQIQKQRRIP